MKVFIAWSGDVSQEVAAVLRVWLPGVIAALEPYVSAEDMGKGGRWSDDIAKQLEESSYGILCVTQSNIESSWLNFEAGALSRTVDRRRVSPFLFRVPSSDFKGPMRQFQYTVYDKSDVSKLMHSLNNACKPQCLKESRLDSNFEVWWPQLKEKLDKIQDEHGQEELQRQRRWLREALRQTSSALLARNAEAAEIQVVVKAIVTAWSQAVYKQDSPKQPSDATKIPKGMNLTCKLCMTTHRSTELLSCSNCGLHCADWLREEKSAEGT